ncbi:MAG: hypothetical protein LBR53_08610 [Deltaproteobacteria bacterium]|jgi:hypothetical protein|nr:hypothetical protein [Deltaproteobacteria bacterium]
MGISRQMGEIEVEGTVELQLRGFQFFSPKIQGENVDENSIEMDVHGGSSKLVVGVETRGKDNEKIIKRARH